MGRLQSLVELFITDNLLEVCLSIYLYLHMYTLMRCCNVGNSRCHCLLFLECTAFPTNLQEMLGRAVMQVTHTPCSWYHETQMAPHLFIFCRHFRPSWASAALW